MQLRFDGARRRWPALLLGRTTFRSRVMGALLLAAGALCFCTAAWRGWALHQDTVRIQHEVEHLRGAPRPVRASAPGIGATALTAQQRSGWNSVASQLNTPWSRLFDALERGTPAHIALVSIEPDPQRHSVRLQAEARTLDALLAYANQLQQVPGLGRITLAKHETNDLDPARPMRLTVEVQLGPPETSHRPDRRSGQ